MSLFLDAAIAWNSLLNTSYRITIGHKNKMSVIRLVFRPGDFDHLSGIHYSSDVDYGLHRREYRGDRLLPALLSGKLDALLIEKSHYRLVHDSEYRFLNLQIYTKQTSFSL